MAFTAAFQNGAPAAEPAREPARLEAWPRLDSPDVAETCATLHLWSQLLGKTKLALAAPVNHWWHVTLRVSARGLTTAAMPAGRHSIEVELDLVRHQLIARRSDGALASMDLRDGSAAGFTRAYFERLRQLDVDVRINPYTVEMPERVRLDQDTRGRRYDPSAAHAFFGALSRAAGVLERFRGQFIGKASPVQFFWGAFDLAATRFSGRAAPPHPGGIPNVGDFVMREAYSHEVSSAGFWPGDARWPEPAFYAYAYPEPAGFSSAAVRPAAARYVPALGEFVLPYAAARAAPDPAGDVLAFLQSTYEAAADLARWDRPALERRPTK
jgi:hypothetical protein